MLAIVLARKNIREFDQTVSLYTREIGKVEVLAKGIKKIISKNSSNLEVLSVVEIEVIQGKDIDYLGRVQSIKFFRNIYSDLDKISLASYVVKIVDVNILVGEKDEVIFNLLFSFLEFLDIHESVQLYQLVTSFTFKLWHRLGFSESTTDLDKWVEKSWAEVSSLDLSRAEVVQSYESAYTFAQNHTGVKLAKFIENGRITL
jgi:DNA repair protein RecO (recombination protein O)